MMWSSTSRRVKGILVGHQRGVRSLSVYEAILLSAGFECEGYLWDLNMKENTAVLKGHRHPIVSAKLMCEMAQAEKDHRALTVDESGEFRLWNIHIQERGNEAKYVPTIQVFTMHHSEPPLNKFRFLALPYNPRFTTSYYSNIIACSSKLMHFLPEKNTKEFIPPTASVFNEAASTIITAVGKSVLTFDVAVGSFHDIFENVSSYDLTALCEFAPYLNILDISVILYVHFLRYGWRARKKDVRGKYSRRAAFDKFYEWLNYRYGSISFERHHLYSAGDGGQSLEHLHQRNGWQFTIVRRMQRKAADSQLFGFCFL